jgi:hypothetical protein
MALQRGEMKLLAADDKNSALLCGICAHDDCYFVVYAVADDA